MIKRIIHITLSFLLLVSTVGFAVSKHYCGDALIDIAYNKNADSCCDDGACCHNENLFYQLDEDYPTPQTLNVPDIQVIEVLGFTIFATSQTPADMHSKTFHNNNSPPPFTLNEILSHNQVFLL